MQIVSITCDCGNTSGYFYDGAVGICTKCFCYKIPGKIIGYCDPFAMSKLYCGCTDNWEYHLLYNFIFQREYFATVCINCGIYETIRNSEINYSNFADMDALRFVEAICV